MSHPKPPVSAIVDRELRLLVFSSESFTGGYGSATALRTFVDATMARTRWHLTVVAPASQLRARQLSTPRLYIAAIPGLESAGRRSQLLAYVGAARLKLKAVERPNAVISWQPVPTATVGRAAAASFGAAHIVRTCGPELARGWSRFPLATIFARPMVNRLLGSADAVVVKSELERGLLGPRVDGERVWLIPNAVGDEFFADQAASSDRRSGLLAVCQLESHKGVGHLLAALRLLPGGNVALTVAGDGSQRPRLGRMVGSSGVEVRFLGRVPHPDMPRVYRRHEALVLPSTLEGCSNAALEAMAAGLPVIGIRTALSDLVTDCGNGVLAETNDPPVLAAAVRRYLGMGEQLPALRAAARRTAERHRSRRVVEGYGELLAAL